MTESKTAHIHLIAALHEARTRAQAPSDVLDLARAASVLGDADTLRHLESVILEMADAGERAAGRAPAREYRELAEAWAIVRKAD